MIILLAEDDAVTREAVTELLEAEGHQVIPTANGTDAIAAWLARRPEMVLLDIMMPGASGYEVCRAIRRQDRHTPVIFLSAKSEEVDVVLGLELGADDFLRKPFGKHELLARIRSVIRRMEKPDGGAGDGVSNNDAGGNGGGGVAAANPGSGAIVFGPWEIYPKRLLAVSRGDGGVPPEKPREVPLTVREVKVIQLLAARRGEVVSRDELLNECWGLEYFPESRTLDQHILNLRRKIERDPAAPCLIETVRGAGYRFPG